MRRVPALAVLATAALVMTTFAAKASNDPWWPRQWGPVQIGAPQAWGASNGAGIKIGVVDTGVDTGHEDLAGKVVATADCRGGCHAGGQDDHGHGTHVSGIAAAATDNGKGIAGVAPGAQLVVAKVLNKDGSGSTDDIAAGIKWVISQGAKVVNLSLGPDVLDPRYVVFGSNLPQAVDDAWAAGAVPVIAAGNENLFLGLGSANYGNMKGLVVGATRPDAQVASYSSPIGDAQWGLVAPGGAGEANANDPNDPRHGDDIISTWPTSMGGYAYDAGTSMATPHVSGAVAILLAKGYTQQGAVDRILQTANQSPPCGSGCHGRLDIAKAVGAGAAPAPSAGHAPTPPAPGQAAAAGRVPAHSAVQAAGASKPAATTTTTAPSEQTTVAAATTPQPSSEVALGEAPKKRATAKRAHHRSPVLLGGAVLLLGGVGTGLGVLRVRRGGAP